MKQNVLHLSISALLAASALSLVACSDGDDGSQGKPGFTGNQGQPGPAGEPGAKGEEGKSGIALKRLATAGQSHLNYLL